MEQHKEFYGMKKDSKGRIIGCGYCAHEKTCSKHDSKINRAKLGCETYKHYEDESH